MRPVSINAEDLATHELDVRFPYGSVASYTAQTSLSPRAGRTPRLESVARGARTLTAQIHPLGGLTDDSYAFETTVNSVFGVEGELIEVVVERVPGDADSRASALATITDLRRVHNQLWEAQLEFPDPSWQSSTLREETDAVIVVGGTATARPVITVEPASNASRFRISVTDRGQGLASYLIGVAWADTAANTDVWSHGQRLPFRVADGRLWFRVDTTYDRLTRTRRAYVDAYASSAITNGDTADTLDDAGTTLDANLAAGTSVVADMSRPGSRPGPPSLCWQPFKTAAHEGSNAYTFGFTGDDTIELVEREGTGQRRQHDDDADSFVITSPVPLSGMSGLALSVFAGYLSAEALADDDDETDSASLVRTQNTKDGAACLRVKVGGIGDGELSGQGHVYTITGDITPGSTQVDVDQAEDLYPDPANPSRDDPWPEQQNELVFALAGSTWDAVRDNRGELGIGDETARRRISTLAAADVTNALQKAADGASVSQDGDAWRWFVTYAAGSYGGQEIPIFSVNANTVDIAILVEQVWVDPITHQPIKDTSNGDGPVVGAVRAVVRYRSRDEEPWQLAWSQVVRGAAPSGTTTAINVPPLAFPGGAVQVAVGVEAAGDGKTTVNWGSLTATSDPTLTFLAGVTPQVAVSDEIDARYIDGTLRNTDTGDWLRCHGVWCDDGLAIDTDLPDITGLGVNVVNGEFSHSAHWHRIRPRLDNTLTVSGTLDLTDITRSFRERWQV